MNFQHLLTLFTGLIECMFFAGITFGWASLVFVLKNEKYFQDLCPSSGNQSINATISCPEQDEQFSIIFIIAAFMNNFMTLPCGFVYDKFGTLITRFLAIFIFTCGTLLIALSTADTAVILFPALSLLTTGGILLMMTNIQVGNLFGSHRSTVITFYNGAFDSSSVVFLIVKVGYQKGASLQTIFICISSCFVWHIIRTLFLMPKAYIPYPLPEDYSYGLHCKKIYQKTSLDPTTANDEVGTDRQEHDASGISFWRCACSSLFIWHVVWLSLMQLRHYMFIATLNPTLSRLSGGDPQIVSYYTNVFALSQCCGILCAPWNGILIDRHKRKQNVSDSQADLRSCVVSLALTATQCLLFSISATIPILPVLYATFILQVLNRSFLYGGNAAFLSIAFPTQHFGKLFGLTMSLSALILVFQYPTFYILRTYLNGDPFYVNIALLILGLLVFIHPINVFRLCRKKDVSKE